MDNVKATKANPQAFPLYVPVGSSIQDWTGGMTLRDYFAATALNGLIIARNGTDQQFAKVAYDMADVMLAARQNLRTT